MVKTKIKKQIIFHLCNIGTKTVNVSMSDHLNENRVLLRALNELSTQPGYSTPENPLHYPPPGFELFIPD